MFALATVLIVVILSLLVARVATVALTLTGMSREAARFQARSALSGVGYTTGEAEQVVNHPVRRRIAMTLMLVGSGGIVTAVASVLLSFTSADTGETENRLLILAAGLLAVFMLSRSAIFDRWLTRIISRALSRWTDLKTRDYARLLHLGGDYAVLELAVSEGDWVADRELGKLGLRDEGLAVLGIERASGSYIAAPGWSTEIRPGDTLIIYGTEDQVSELDRRRRGEEGDEAHRRAVEKHRLALGEEAGAR